MSDSPSLVVVQILPDELDLTSTLTSGQLFRWQRAGDSWTGVVGREIWRFTGLTGGLGVERFGSGGGPAAERFLRLDVDLGRLTDDYTGCDDELADAVQRFAGLRIVRQPAADALIGFVCSTANSIPRISRSLEALAEAFGDQIGELDGRSYAALPTWRQLAEANPGELWQRADLGYRARLLQQIGEVLADRGEDWLESLAEMPYLQAHSELMQLPGVGPKVADCVCLYGLGFDEAVPIDSHVWAIASELFGPAVPTGTLTPRTYRRIGDLFRSRYPVRTGWAQHYLFHRRRMSRSVRTREIAVA